MRRGHTWPEFPHWSPRSHYKPCSPRCEGGRRDWQPGGCLGPVLKESRSKRRGPTVRKDAFVVWFPWVKCVKDRTSWSSGESWLRTRGGWFSAAPHSPVAENGKQDDRRTGQPSAGLRDGRQLRDGQHRR